MEQWVNCFFEEPHVLAFAILGWIQGFFIVAIAVGTRRVLRKESLFPFLSIGPRHEATGAQPGTSPDSGPAEGFGVRGPAAGRHR